MKKENRESAVKDDGIGMSVELHERVPPPCQLQSVYESAHTKELQSAEESTHAKTNHYGNGALRQSMIALDGNPEMAQQSMAQHGIGARQQSITSHGNLAIKQISEPDTHCVITLTSEGCFSTITRFGAYLLSLFVSTQLKGCANILDTRSGYALNHEALLLHPRLSQARYDYDGAYEGNYFTRFHDAMNETQVRAVDCSS